MPALALFLLKHLREDRGRRLMLLAGLGLAVVVGLTTAAVLVVTTVVDGFYSGAQTQASSTACISAATTQQPSGQWSAQQVTNADTIIRVGVADHVPRYGEIIAVATSMQEATLNNLDHGDQDSLGLFQQRTSQGWGSPAQLMDPVYASNQFYKALQQVPGWQSMPLTVAAQAVQHSGVPGAYAQWQQAATTLVSHAAGATLTAAGPVPGAGACAAGQVAQGSVQRLDKALAYAYAALGSPYVFGGSCTHPHSPVLIENCDCSSLVQQSFRQAGLNLPRVAEDQWAWGEGGHAQVIPLDQAQVGDVVYLPSYLGPNKIGHTGIVVNPKKMIMLDAYDTGQPVEFNSYAPSADRYGSHLLTILRFINTSGGAAA